MKEQPMSRLLLLTGAALALSVGVATAQAPAFDPTTPGSTSKVDPMRGHPGVDQSESDTQSALTGQSSGTPRWNDASRDSAASYARQGGGERTLRYAGGYGRDSAYVSRRVRRHHHHHHYYHRPYAANAYGEDVAYEGGGGHYVVTNGPVPDTPANRARYGSPLSRAGKMTPPVGD